MFVGNKTLLIFASRKLNKKQAVMKTKELRDIMTMAWDFVKRFGYSLSEALKTAWANAKFKKVAATKIVEFYFKKIDGSVRQAFGTLRADLCPVVTAEGRAKADTVQVYFDTEKQAWRCFKKCNLLFVK